ncbi:unnamed protein product [Orchesella dallaii]|uniref:EF-hand domain-containing protein n=1 Tax=Orchesella dallaii TaxID=48710 RepID=A0ABP1QBD9_9HEXA
MMFEYFLGLCVIHQPPDPWSFISEIAGKIREARNNIQTFDNLPRILTPEHTEAIFRIYDRIENGFITMSQYKSAMEAMGLSRFSMNPDGWEEDTISKDTFVKESTEAISDLLRSFMVFIDTNPDAESTQKRTSEEQSGTGESRSRSASYTSSTGEYTGSSEMKSREGTGSDTEFPRNAEDAPLNLNLMM